MASQEFKVNIDCGVTVDGKFFPVYSKVSVDPSQFREAIAKQHLVAVEPPVAVTEPPTKKPAE